MEKQPHHHHYQYAHSGKADQTLQQFGGVGGRKRGYATYLSGSVFSHCLNQPALEVMAGRQVPGSHPRAYCLLTSAPESDCMAPPPPRGDQPQPRPLPLKQASQATCPLQPTHPAPSSHSQDVPTAPSPGSSGWFLERQNPIAFVDCTRCL